MTNQTSLYYDSAADAARAAGVSNTHIIDQCKTGAIPGAYQSSDGWWRVPVDGMRAAGHEVTGEGAHLIGPLDRQLPEPTIIPDGTPDGTPEWGSGVRVHGSVVYAPELHLDDLDFARAFALDVLAAAAWVEKGADQ